MNDALEVLKVKWDLFVLALRIALLKLLGVDVLIERAFKEGYSMAQDTDWHRWETFSRRKSLSVNDLCEIIHETRCWRSVDEAWANSDAQEIFDENA